jgi:hypothetical protein
MKDLKPKLQQYMQSTKTYIVERSDTFIGIGVVIGLLAIVGAVALINHLSGPQIVYQPIKACDLFTPTQAQSLLGEKINGVDKNEPQISGNLAVSKCGYSDLNSAAITVAAVTIRTGINDDGITQNKSDFAKSKKNNATEKVPQLGDSAFFNAKVGQLNVLKGGNWYIFNYGLGDSPEQNTLDKALELARKVLG